MLMELVGDMVVAVVVGMMEVGLEGEEGMEGAVGMVVEVVAVMVEEGEGEVVVGLGRGGEEWPVAERRRIIACLLAYYAI